MHVKTPLSLSLSRLTLSHTHTHGHIWQCCYTQVSDTPKKKKKETTDKPNKQLARLLTSTFTAVARANGILLSSLLDISHIVAFLHSPSPLSPCSPRSLAFPSPWEWATLDWFIHFPLLWPVNPVRRDGGGGGGGGDSCVSVCGESTETLNS